MGEVTILAKNSPKFASLKTTVPMTIVKQWKLSPGSELDWSWEVVNGELAIVVRKIEHKQKVAEVKPEPQKPILIDASVITDLERGQIKRERAINKILDHVMESPKLREEFKDYMEPTELKEIEKSRSGGREIKLKPKILEKLKEIVMTEYVMEKGTPEMRQDLQKEKELKH